MEFEKAREGQAFVPFVQPSKDHNLPLNYRKAQAALLVVRFWPSAVMICIEALGLIAERRNCTQELGCCHC